jgi:hypothetical protein
MTTFILFHVLGLLFMLSMLSVMFPITFERLHRIKSIYTIPSTLFITITMVFYMIYKMGWTRLKQFALSMSQYVFVEDADLQMMQDGTFQEFVSLSRNWWDFDTVLNEYIEIIFVTVFYIWLLMV